MESGAYSLVNDPDGSTKLVIENLHEQFFKLEEQKEKIIAQFGHLIALVSENYTFVSNALSNSKKATKMNLIPNILDDVEELLTEFETWIRLLDIVEKDWEAHLTKL